MKTYPVLNVTAETTHQQVYDAIVQHLEEQGGPAYENNGCQNRTSGGKACAAACLFTDDEAYRAPSWISMHVEATRRAPAGLTDERVTLGLTRLLPFDDLLQSMQQMHDDFANHEATLSHKGGLALMNERLAEVAEAFKLTPRTLTHWAI